MKYLSKTGFSIITFVVTFGIYLLTLAPDLNFTDAGELAGVCYTLGIGHPTGYPLFTILGFLWSHLPLPFTKIYLMNLFAAFTTAFSAVFFFRACLIIVNNFLTGSLSPKTKKPVKGKKNQPVAPVETVQENQLSLLIISFISALLFAFSATVWSISNSIEVYSLEALIMSLIIYSELLAVTTPDKENRYFLMTAFFIGLGFSNHMTTMLLLPGVLFLYFKKPGNDFDFSAPKIKYLFVLLLPFLLGLSFQLYQPIRAAQMPEFNWGYVSRSFDKYLYHVSGKQYQVWMFTGSEAFYANLNKFLNIFPAQISWLGFIPLVYGIYFLYNKSRDIFWFSLLLIIGCLVYSLNYSIHDIESYFLLAVIGVTFIVLAGIKGLVSLQPKIYPLFFILPLLSLVSNYKDADESDNLLVPEYTRIMSENLKPNAIIISSQWDFFCSAFWYKQRVEHYRPDVVIVEKELLRRTWYLEQLKRWYPQVMQKVKNEADDYLKQLELFESGQSYSVPLIQQRFINLINAIISTNIDKRPVYLTLEILQSQEDAAIGNDYEKIPEGFAFRLEKDKKIYPVNVDNIWVDNFIKGLKKDNHLVKGIGELTSVNIANIGRYAFVTGQYAVAEKAFRLSLKVDRRNPTAAQGLEALQTKQK